MKKLQQLSLFSLHAFSSLFRLISLNYVYLLLILNVICFVSGTDQSQAQLLGPDRQILGFAGMSPEDSSCGAEDFGFIQVK